MSNRTAALFGALALLGGLTGSAQSPTADLTLIAVSARPDMVSGGNVLVRLRTDAATRSQDVRIALNGVDVTSAFRPDTGGRSLTGLVRGLLAGPNSLTAAAGRATATLDLTNYPITGPIFSGPHSVPFVCETESAGLGVALDAACSAATRVSYYYKPEGQATFTLLP